MAAVTTRYEFIPPEDVILGASGVMSEVRDKLEKVASTDAPVLIRGEAGTGKEILARLIHKKYPGSVTPFHKVAPAGRAGWRKTASFVLSQDAASGANGNGNGYHIQEAPLKPSCIGTLYFDEVAELNPISQRNLTQLVHDDRPSGMKPSEYSFPLFRIICSTKHDIEREVKLGSFCEDLFYAVNIVSLNLPPLRARREDIPGWVHYFWKYYRDELDLETPVPSAHMIKVLQAYGWPGNIRELASLMKRYVILGSGDRIIEELTGRSCLSRVCNAPPVRGISLKSLAKQEAQEIERKIIVNTLRETQWNRKRAARVLNISYRTLLYKIKEAGVPPKRIVVKGEKQN